MKNIRFSPARVSFFALALSCSAGWLRADITYIGRAVFPGGPNAPIADFSGLPHTTLEDDKTFQDRFDGFGSGLAYTGFNNRFLLLNDRGPNKNTNTHDSTVDNTTSYLDRFQVADITLSGSGDSYNVNVNPVWTSLLRNGSGQNYIGISSAFTSAVDPTQNLRLDPEGIAVSPDGTVYISDEYGPVIYHFDQSGQRIGSLPVPAKFLIAAPKKTVAAEISGNTSGRVGNKGMEGLAITPNGQMMVGAMQSPLLQDAPVSGTNSTGTNIRFLKYDLTNPSATPKEYVYQLDNNADLVSEITPINNHQFLVDERDAVGGTSGGVKKLYLVDLNQANATDVSGIANLATTGDTSGVTALSKIQFADIGALLRAAPGALDGGKLPDKFEGYAFGPDLADGRHTLLVTNDNDYADPNSATTYNGYVFAFAVSNDYLASIGVTDFQLRSLNPGVTFVPEPATLSLISVGMLGLLRRHSRRV